MSKCIQRQMGKFPIQMRCQISHSNEVSKSKLQFIVSSKVLGDLATVIRTKKNAI